MSEYMQGKSTEALAIYDLLYHANPQLRLDPGNMLQWANIAINAGRPLDAITSIAKIQSLFPQYVKNNSVLVEFAKGRAYDAIHDWPHALQCFSNVLNLGAGGDQIAKAYVPVAREKINEIDYTLKYSAPARPSVNKEMPDGKTPIVFRVAILLLMIIPPIFMLIYHFRSARAKKT
jgi:tetratricopeptide (TPR) repeat protein